MDIVRENGGVKTLSLMRLKNKCNGREGERNGMHWRL
jgi:hypothetical protein